MSTKIAKRTYKREDEHQAPYHKKEIPSNHRYFFFKKKSHFIKCNEMLNAQQKIIVLREIFTPFKAYKIQRSK